MATFEELVKSIKSKDIKGCYIFYGEEPFFVDYLSDLILDHALPESERGFCQQVFYGRDVDTVALRDTCMTVPMSFSANPRQVIVVREAQDAAKKMDPIYSYLKQPNDCTILVLVFKNMKTLDKKMPTKLATIFKSELLKDKDMPKWIESQFKLEGYKIQDDAIRTIIEYAGTHLERIFNEIQKLIITIPKEKSITSLEIQQSFGISREYTIFELTNALGEKNAKTVFKIISFYAQNEKKMRFELMLGNLFPFFKTLYQIKLGQRMKLSTQQIGAELGMSVNQNWLIDKQQKYCANYSISQLESALLCLSEYDQRRKGIKGAAMEYQDLLVEMCLRIMQ